MEQEASVLMTQAAKRRSMVERARGFQKAESSEERAKRISSMKQRMPCNACRAHGKTVFGHWHSDKECPYFDETKKKKDKSAFITENGDAAEDHAAFVVGQASSEEEGDQDDDAFLVHGTGLGQTCLREESINLGLSDTCCAKTVAGREWVRNHVEKLKEHGLPFKYLSEREPFRIGGGPKVFSSMALVFPLCIPGCRVPVMLRTSIVDQDVPLLISRGALQAMGMIMNLVDSSVRFEKLDCSTGLVTTSTGHVGFHIMSNDAQAWRNGVDWAMAEIKKEAEIFFADESGGQARLRTGAASDRAAPKKKQEFIDRILESPKINLGASDLQAMSLDRIKEIYRTLKPKKEAGPLPVGWKRGAVETLRNFYIEKVATYYLRDKNERWKEWTKSRFTLEIEMYEADVVEELALTGTTAAKMTTGASASDNPGPLAPTCPTCGVEMLERTNRVTAGGARGGVPDNGGYPRSPDPSVVDSQASWQQVSERMATSSDGHADQKYNVNLTEAEMKALTERPRSLVHMKRGVAKRLMGNAYSILLTLSAEQPRLVVFDCPKIPTGGDTKDVTMGADGSDQDEEEGRLGEDGVTFNVPPGRFVFVVDIRGGVMITKGGLSSCRIMRPRFVLRNEFGAWKQLERAVRWESLDDPKASIFDGAKARLCVQGQFDPDCASGEVKVDAPTIQKVTFMFPFGEWSNVAREKKVRYCGKEVCVEKRNGKQCIVLKQKDFVLGKLDSIPLSADRKRQPDSAATGLERTDFRSTIGSLQWLSTQSRPDISFEVNQLQKRIPDLKVFDLLRANALVREVKNSDSVELVFENLGRGCEVVVSCVNLMTENGKK
ncbi:NLRC3, partial [Symbiodinium pilosum]